MCGINVHNPIIPEGAISPSISFSKSNGKYVAGIEVPLVSSLSIKSFNALLLANYSLHFFLELTCFSLLAAGTETSNSFIIEQGGWEKREEVV